MGTPKYDWAKHLFVALIFTASGIAGSYLATGVERTPSEIAFLFLLGSMVAGLLGK